VAAGFGTAGVAATLTFALATVVLSAVVLSVVLTAVGAAFGGLFGRRWRVWGAEFEFSFGIEGAAEVEIKVDAEVDAA
jgi:hypothetical protein